MRYIVNNRVRGDLMSIRRKGKDPHPTIGLLPVVALLYTLMIATANATSMFLSSTQQVYEVGDNVRIVAQVSSTEDVPVRVRIIHSLRDL